MLNSGTDWIVEFTDEFGEWWECLSVEVQEKIYKVVGLLELNGPRLSFPYSSEIKGSSIALRELRIQCGGDPYRVLYAFDPVRHALLLIGGNKSGNDDWYEKNVPIAERLFMDHLKELKEEGI